MIELGKFQIKPLYFALASFLIAIGSLSAAWIAQYGFDLMPCKLCLMQRLPYWGIAGLSLAAAALRTRRGPYALTLVLISATYGIGAAIAAFHSGVERHWWTYESDCTRNQAWDPSMPTDQFIDAIRSAPVVPCDEIPWALFGLSFANYNTIFSAFMTVFVLYVAVKVWRGRKTV